MKGIADILLLAVALATYVQSAAAANFTNHSDLVKSSNGYIKLEWDTAEAKIVELQQSKTPTFDRARTIYSGPDSASFVTGLADGNYYFRIRSDNSPWSEILTVQVQHPSLSFAVSLFLLGAFVFFMTVLVIVDGMRKSAREET